MNLNRVRKWLVRGRLSKTRKDPRVAVFHHLPKCAGTSLVDALGHYFRIVRDYRQPNRPGGASGYCLPHNLATLSPKDLLCGHFEFPGVHLFERYPGIAAHPEDYFLFTFLREPLELKCSLLRYEGEKVTIDRLLERPNYMASCLGVVKEDLEEVLRRYDFIGSVESMKDDFPMLLENLGFPGPVRVNVSRLNRTGNKGFELSPRHLERFREVNSLDYHLYSRRQRHLPGS